MDIREFGDIETDRWPGVDDDGRIAIAADEEVHASRTSPLRFAYADGTGKWRQLWESPEPGVVEITDRRVAFSAKKFDIGTYYGGAPVWTAASRGLAKHRRKGKLAAGHIRYEWVTRLSVGVPKGLLATGLA